MWLCMLMPWLCLVAIQGHTFMSNMPGRYKKGTSVATQEDLHVIRTSFSQYHAQSWLFVNVWSQSSICIYKKLLFYADVTYWNMLNFVWCS